MTKKSEQLMSMKDKLQRYRHITGTTTQFYNTASSTTQGAVQQHSAAAKGLSDMALLKGTDCGTLMVSCHVYDPSQLYCRVYCLLSM
jgi:hypothetical protein